MKYSSLIKAATDAKAQAYAPYSNFPVGAALLTASGEIFPGANIENASFGLTICAERAAVCAAVSAGKKDFVAIAVVSGSEAACPPCGACRQVLAEFNPELQVIMSTTTGHRKEASLSELLPLANDGLPTKMRNV
jgi:cytidine deaminase